MAYYIFVTAIAIYGITMILSVLDTMSALTMRRSVRAIVYWMEKFAGAIALLSGILYMAM